MSAFSGHFDLIISEDPSPLFMKITFELAIEDSVELHVNGFLDNLIELVLTILYLILGESTGFDSV
jgi:hypothetical protein